MHSQQSSSEWGQINNRIRRHSGQLEVGVSQEEWLDPYRRCDWTHRALHDVAPDADPLVT